MSYFFDVILTIARIDDDKIEPIQKFINDMGYYDQKFEVCDTFYQTTLIGSFRSFLRNKFIEFLQSLEWDYEDKVQLLVRGEDEDKFRSWSLTMNTWDNWTWDCYKYEKLAMEVKYGRKNND